MHAISIRCSGSETWEVINVEDDFLLGLPVVVSALLRSVVSSFVSSSVFSSVLAFVLSSVFSVLIVSWASWLSGLFVFPWFSWLSGLFVFSVLSGFSWLFVLSGLSLFSWFSFRLWWLGIEAEQLRVEVFSQTDFVGVLSALLLASFLSFLFCLFVLFGLEDGQLFLLDPLSVDLAFLDGLFLVGCDIAELDSLVAIVLVECDALRLFWFFLLSWLLSSVVFSLLDVLLLVDLVVEVANTSVTSSFLAGSVSTASSASPVQVVASSWHFLGRNHFVVPFLSGVFPNSLWEVLVDSSSWLGSLLGFADLGFLGLLPLLMGCIRGELHLFGGFCSAPVAVVNFCSSSSLTSKAANGFICDW